MTMLAVDNFCRLACAYCRSLGALAPQPLPPKEAEAHAGAGAVFSCGIAFAREQSALAEAAGRVRARVLVHGELSQPVRLALLDAIARSGARPVFLVDRREFRWREADAEASARGLEAEFTVLALRSIPPAAILSALPAGFTGKISLFFPKHEDDADFFLADEAVVLLRELRLLMPGLEFLPFGAGDLPFFDSFSEADYFAQFVRHGRSSRIRWLVGRAFSGGAAWLPVRMAFGIMAFIASLLLDTKRARDAALSAANSTYWTGHRGLHTAYLGLNAIFWTSHDACQRTYLGLNSAYWTSHDACQRTYLGLNSAYWTSHDAYHRAKLAASPVFWAAHHRVSVAVNAIIWGAYHRISVAVNAIIWGAYHLALETKVGMIHAGWYCYNRYWVVRKWCQKHRVYDRLTYPVRKPWYFFSYQLEKRLLGKVYPS